MHISQELKIIIKICKYWRRVYAPGLACVADKVRFHRRTTKVKLGTNTIGGQTFSET
jgi:hypothetical protein